MIAAEGKLEPSSVLIGVLPMYHIYGMQCIMNAGGLYQGSTVVTLPKYQLQDFLEVCQSAPTSYMNGMITNPTTPIYS